MSADLISDLLADAERAERKKIRNAQAGALSALRGFAGDTIVCFRAMGVENRCRKRTHEAACPLGILRRVIVSLRAATKEQR
jgi:hypothetical protein